MGLLFRTTAPRSVRLQWVDVADSEAARVLIGSFDALKKVADASERQLGTSGARCDAQREMRRMGGLYDCDMQRKHTLASTFFDRHVA